MSHLQLSQQATACCLPLSSRRLCCSLQLVLCSLSSSLQLGLLLHQASFEDERYSRVSCSKAAEVLTCQLPENRLHSV